MVIFSIAKVEYIEATHVHKEAICLMKFYSEVGLSLRDIIVQCDSNNDIYLAKNLTFHAKEKHTDIQYHFVRDMVEDEKMILDKFDTLQNGVDALVKLVSIVSKFKWCCESMGLMGLNN